MDHEMTTLILNGNTYSLLSVIFEKFPVTAPSDSVHIRNMKLMDTLEKRIRSIWNTYGRTGWEGIGINLKRMWATRALMVRMYLRRHPQSVLGDMFSMLMHWNGTKTKNAQRIVSTKTKKHKKNSGCRCDIM